MTINPFPSPTAAVDPSVPDPYPQNVGILAIETYFPALCVDQTDLEKHDGSSAGKYTIGLGQTRMGFCGDREDINSICLTVVQSLMEKYNVSYSSIGRLEVGTETIIDKSKSVKSVLMQLFADSGNEEVEGIDTTNACYGGTNALFNAIAWIESSAWDGRLALVVAGDIAVYASGPARPTGGAGVVAMLLGRNAPLTVERGLRGSHFEHVYDFYKPDLSSEYPEVDGKLSINCYLRSLDRCYNRYLDRLQLREPDFKAGLDSFDYIVFHSPFTKLVQKSFGRLLYNDARRAHQRGEDLVSINHPLAAFVNLSEEESYASKNLETAAVQATQTLFAQKTGPSLMLAKMVGNIYCGSVYGGLASLISNVKSEELVGKRVAMFSYGSGSAASFFSFRVNSAAQVSRLSSVLDMSARLESRCIVAPEHFVKTMHLREETHNEHPYTPQDPVDALFPGTYYLVHVDEKFRRSYERRPLAV